MAMKYLAVAALALTASSVSAASLHSQFTFDTDKNATTGSATATGEGDVATGRYVFDRNEGLNVALNATLNTWSIVFRSRIDNVSGYDKLIDFSGLSSDNGLYSFGGKLHFYNTAGSSSATLSAATDAMIALTYDGTTTTGYVDGAKQFTFTTTGTGYPAALSSFVMFEDDTSTGKSEAAGGSLDFLDIYNGALTDQEVAEINSPAPVVNAVPVPAPALLLLGGLGALAGMRRRR